MIALSTQNNGNNQCGENTIAIPIIIEDDDENVGSTSVATSGGGVVGINRARLAGSLVRTVTRPETTTVQMNCVPNISVSQMTSVPQTGGGMSVFTVQSNGLPTRFTHVNRSISSAAATASSSVGPLIAHVGSLKEPGFSVSPVQVPGISPIQIGKPNPGQMQTFTIPSNQVTCVPSMEGNGGMPMNTIFVLPSPLNTTTSTGSPATFTGASFTTAPTPAPAVAAAPAPMPSQSFQIAPSLANPPAYLNASSAIAPGQVHRLLLTPSDGNTPPGAPKSADLAIVYLGQNCWRPIVLPSGFDTMNHTGPLLGQKSNPVHNNNNNNT